MNKIAINNTYSEQGEDSPKLIHSFLKNYFGQPGQPFTLQTNQEHTAFAEVTSPDYCILQENRDGLYTIVKTPQRMWRISDAIAESENREGLDLHEIAQALEDTVTNHDVLTAFAPYIENAVALGGIPASQVAVYVLVVGNINNPVDMTLSMYEVIINLPVELPDATPIRTAKSVFNVLPANDIISGETFKQLNPRGTKADWAFYKTTFMQSINHDSSHMEGLGIKSETKITRPHILKLLEGEHRNYIHEVFMKASSCEPGFCKKAKK